MTSAIVKLHADSRFFPLFLLDLLHWAPGAPQQDSNLQENSSHLRRCWIGTCRSKAHRESPNGIGHKTTSVTTCQTCDTISFTSASSRVEESCQACHFWHVLPTLMASYKPQALPQTQNQQPEPMMQPLNPQAQTMSSEAWKSELCRHLLELHAGVYYAMPSSLCRRSRRSRSCA